MANYGYKDEAALTYDANKRRLRVEGAILLARVMNEALNEMTKQFNDAYNRGGVYEIGGSQDELRELFRQASQRELGSA